ncbi:MAG: BspA family leucine-rich repeat surface protein [Bacteroidales bacterium]|nr:BspA family leucine-rich repeat surface protein [Bacteroidales bacterium]
MEKNVKKVVFEKSFSAYRPTYCAGWFADCINLTEIDGIQYLNTENVTNMWGMFYGCSSLTTLDLSKFKTEKVTFMYSMFKYCDNLTNLDLGNFNTNNVTDMSYMFNDCSSLTNLDLSSFNTKNVTNISAMFEGCKNLADLNMSNFDTKNVTNMRGMFSGCSSLTTLDLSSFDTEKAELRDMFTGCSNLTTIFAGDKWSTKSVYVGIDEDDEWGNEEVYVTGDMFAGCTSLVGGKGTKFDENNITYTYAHIDGGKGNPGYLTAVEIVSISVTTLPKTTYLEGEDLNLDGGIVSVNYNNGSIETADLAKAEISGFDKTKSGEQNLTVKYMGKETSFIVTVKSPTPYATFTDGTLTLGYGSDIPNNATKISGEVVQSLSKSTSSNYIASDITAAKNVQKVVFDKTFADYQPENCAYWFNGCNNLTGIDGMENLDTKNTTDMTAMFQNCEKLASLDLSGFNTTKVTDMSKMFSNCMELATIFVGDTWNMSNVEKSQDMFKNCQKLVGGNGTKYDVNHSDEDFAKIDGKNSGYFTKAGQEPYKVAEPYAVFDNGTLTFYYDGNKPDGAFEMRTSKDDGWTSVASEIIKVVFDNSFADYRPTSCEYWFFNCSNLTKIEGIKNLNTEDVTSIRSMFNRCEKLESIDLSSFNTKNVTNMRYTFYGCNNLKALDLSKFNTEKVTNMKSMFCYCNNLKTLDLSSFNTKNVTDMCFMLDSCVNLKTVDLSSFNTKNVTDMYDMFAYCYNLSTIDLSNFDTRNVTNMHGVFYKCTNLKTIDVSGFDTKNVTDMSFLFSNCEKLQNIDLSNFDTRNVTDMKAMFQSCASLQNLDLGCFNTKNVTDMSYMFTMCSSLNTISVGDDWSTSSVTESKKMFPQCAALVGGKGTTFNSDKIDKTYARIDGGKDNPGYFTKSGEKPYEEPTPVSEITPAKDNIDIWSFDKTIYVQNPGKEIRIVDMSGRLVKTVKATADRMEIPMQKSGIYIVKTGAKTQKVMIQ